MTRIARNLVFTSFLFYSSLLMSGPGGLSGGSTQQFQRGDKIHFQEESTWVSVLYNKSLCHDGQDYWARVQKCAVEANDNGKCLERQKVQIRQPLRSSKKRCKRSTRSQCVVWEDVPYIQAPKRIIEKQEGRARVQTIRKTVPRCL